MEATNDIAKCFGVQDTPAPIETVKAVEPGVPQSAELPQPPPAEKVEVPSMMALADRVMRQMRVNYDERSTNGINERLKYDVMAQTCSYDDKQKAFLSDIGINERIYSPVTSVKVRAAKSMLMELVSYGEEAPFSIHPTPDPEVPEEIVTDTLQKVFGEIQQLESMLEGAGVGSVPPEVAEKMKSLVEKAMEVGFEEGEGRKDDVARSFAKGVEKRVLDAMVQGGYKQAVLKCLDDVCTYGTCVLKGPFLRNVAHNKVTEKKDGVRKIRRVVDSVPCYEAISPVDCYPAPGAESVTDGPLCVRVRYTREQLWRFRSSSASGRRKGDEGWRDEAVRKIMLERKDGVSLVEFPADENVRTATAQPLDDVHDCKYEGVEYMGYVDGYELLELGITVTMAGVKVLADEMYYCDVIVIGGEVVFCRIYDERIGCPLSKGVFYSVPGSWWGESIADKLYADQSMMNNAIVALLRNMGFASSSMMWINDASRLVDKSEDAYTAEAGKVFAFTNSYAGQQAAGAPMGVLQIPSNAQELLRVAEYVNKQVDIDSGIPAFSEGTGGSNGGALRTAEGLRTYTEASSRGMKMVVTTFDQEITCATAQRTANMLMLQDVSIRGDIEVRPVGIMGKILRAQNDQARVQLFNLCLNSQVMQQILGVKGIVEMFRPSLKDANMNADNICPSVERMNMLEQIEQIKAIFQATAQAQGVQEASAPQGGEGGGMQSGVQPVRPVGGVSERRAVA